MLRTTKLTSRVWVAGGAVVGLLMLAAAWLVVISPVRSDASALRVNAADVQTQNVVLLAKNNKLRDLAQHKKQLVTELDAALGGLPSGPGLPVFSRQLATQAAARGITLTGVSIGSPTSPSTTAAATNPADTSTATSAESSNTSETTSAAPTSTSPTASQSLAIPVTITATGPALQQLFFVRDIQSTGPRLALVTSSSLSPTLGAATDGSIDDASTLTLQVTVFTNPLPQATRQQLSKLTDIDAK